MSDTLSPAAGTAGTDADTLADAVRDRFKALVPDGGGTVLAFQPIPTPLDPADYLRPGTTEVEPVRAGIQLGLVADTVGELVGGDFHSGTVTASGLFGLLLGGRATGTAEEAAVYGRLRGDAEQRYTGDPHTVVATPKSWCAPDGLGWTSFSWSADQHTASGPAGSGEADPGAPAPWQWRVLSEASMQDLSQSVAAAPDGAEGEAAVARTLDPSTLVRIAFPDPPQEQDPTVGLSRLRLLDRPDVAQLLQESGTPQVAAEPAGPELLDPLLVVRAARELDRSTVGRSAAGTSLAVTFEYSQVQLSRPWWDGLLLHSTGWELPGFPAASLGPGPSGGQAPPWGLPVGMVLVRNVTIAGSWSREQLDTVEGSIAFGPFSLLGRQVEQSADAASVKVTVNGMQLFAWLVEVLPQLPPGVVPSPAGAPAVDGSAEVVVEVTREPDGRAAGQDGGGQDGGQGWRHGGEGHWGGRGGGGGDGRHWGGGGHH
ncbi:hypothetical protein GCM10018781_36740 [Kitasatospora indigofera]|uniref:Uncharacterized protein n=1 Tax=Kitasatospora indigofera TaxID=67307 RepID=A0A919FW93_9ACTN|nr:hypothetical protein [Kitasatospora indigofera]GHH73109.1 hypothetical protein GCM10018781_36740 [Kitasatospora indigofera]